MRSCGRHTAPLLIAALLFFPAALVRATTFTVNDPGTAVDATPGDGICSDGRSGVCTLTGAIQEANASPGNDQIDLPAGTYDLSAPFSTSGDGSSQGLPPITSNVTVSGAGSGTTVVERTAGTFRLLTVEASGTLLLAGVTLGGGDAGTFDGGAVIVRGSGTLVLASCGVYANAHTAVVAESGSSLAVNACTFAGNTGTNGGAIRGEFASVAVAASTFTANTSTNQGGAIWLEAADVTPLTIVDSTLSANGTVEAGGGVFVTGNPRLRIERSTLAANHGGGAGGAVAATEGVVRLVDATVSGNDAGIGGGLAAFAGTPLFELASTTVTQNQAMAETGGGIAAAARLRNTILAANTAVGGGHDCSTAGPLESAGYNVVGTETGCDWTSGVGDQVGTDASPLAPGLDALAANGGLTETHALLTTSPAGEAGNPAGCTDTDGVTSLTTDQRGQSRIQDGDSDGAPRCDVGAYEAPPGTFPPPATTTSTTTTSSTSSTSTTTTSTSSSTTSSSSPTTTTSSTTTSSSVTTTTALPGGTRACIESPVLFSGDGAKTMASGGVGSFWVSSSRIVYDTAEACLGTAPGPIDSAQVRRVAFQCSGRRKLFDANPAPPPCQAYRIESTVFADDAHVYWLDATGLRRLPLTANVGDPTSLVTGFIVPDPGAGTAEVVGRGPDEVAVLHPTAGGGIEIRRVDKASGVVTPVLTSATGGSRLASDGEYLYYLDDLAQLIEVHPGLPPFIATTTRIVASDVDGYAAEGPRLVCVSPTNCFTTRFVYFGQGPSVFQHDVDDMATDPTPVYTSTDVMARLRDLASTGRDLFFFEHRNTGEIWLVRTGRSPGLDQREVLRAWAGVSAPDRPHHLATALLPAGPFLFWTEHGALVRLPANAEELPLVDLQARSIEVVQSIQSTANDVPLIRDKTTYARFHVKANGANVPGVTALLLGLWTEGGFPKLGGALLPVNPGGAYLTVQANPQRSNIDHSFLFKLPTSWTHKTNLRLWGVVNANEYPPEDDYSNNQLVTAPLVFNASKRLEIQLVSWGFELLGQTHYPRYKEDILGAIDWVRRTYPLASSGGWVSDSSPGFRPGLWTIFDPKLGAKVDRSDPHCASVPYDTHLCASEYTNIKMGALRALLCLAMFPQPCPYADRFFYGMIADIGDGPTQDYFPRGQACCAPKASSGPAGPPAFRPFAAWDTDASYADTYAGHEIGHTLGRAHPAAGSGSCGHSASDSMYPYANASIGPNSGASAGTLAGFDVGGGPLAATLAVLPSATWTDIMSYCSYNWISDYTFEGMLETLEAEAAAGPTPARPRGVVLPIDLLAVHGVVTADGSAAEIVETQHLALPTAPPLPAPGSYLLRLADGVGTPLAEHPFEPDPAEATEAGPSSRGFALFVPFVAGTRAIEIVGPGDLVLASVAVSANAPVIDRLELVPPPSGPVTGTIALDWVAGDADGDPLVFDALYSRDGGTTFQPLAVNVPGAPFDIDTDQLGSGTAVLRLLASDGVNVAMADTPPFEVAAKPPLPLIHDPADGAQFLFGQLVTLEGEAPDLQDGSVAAGQLVWTLDGASTPLGTGPEVDLEDLGVGAHVVTLTATNSDGLSAETSVSLSVVDDLSLPGPTLSVAPTQVAFHVAPGETQLQSADLEVSNIGDGMIGWTASASAPWLGVLPLSGPTPSTMTLTADPLTVADGQALETIVVVTPDAGTGLPVPVRVVLAKGDLFAGVGGTVTTTTLVSTTTTTLPECVPPDCDDGDACTADACVPGTGCTNVPLTGVGYARCLCGTVPDACAGETIPASILAKADSACSKLEAAEAAADKQQRKLLGKAAKVLRKAAKKAREAGGGKRPALESECSEALELLYRGQRERAQAAREAGGS